jgi:alkanesulfonate monooxygenase SsuD/methylene tetrahydromethanopterin reductase-like flavin-dependent oxidoreductase (luciferase family)
MRFYCYLNPQTPGPVADGPIIKAITEQAITADQAGFAAVCLTEHHFSDYNTYGNSFQYGSYLAGKLSQAWVILTVAVAPLHNPLALVEQANLLDQLLSGRLIVGLGSGGSPLEFDGFNRDPADRARLSNEVIDAALRAWAHRPEDGPFDYKTTFDSGRMRGRIMPAPYRLPHPLLGKSAINQAGAREAGRRGWPLFYGRVDPQGAQRIIATYRAGLDAGGHDAETIEICRRWSAMQKTVWLAETDDEAFAQTDGPLGELGRLSDRAFGSVMDEAHKKSVVGVAASDRQAFIEGATIIGSPDTFSARLAEYEEAGVEQMALHFSFGFADADRVRRSFDLFVDKVMPRFSS